MENKNYIYKLFLKYIINILKIILIYKILSDKINLNTRRDLHEQENYRNKTR